MTALRVLLTATTLDGRGGSDHYVHDLAIGLLRRGHTPVVFSPVLGAPAHRMRMATVPVVDDLEKLETPPDVIHGSHHLETIAACLRFPGVPALHVCHAWHLDDALPPRFPRVRRYVAVDETCRDRLLFEEGLPESRVVVHQNAVDLQRFHARGPLPARPRHALVFSNYATEDGTLAPIREACRRAGIELDVLGAGVGRPCERPEEVLGRYDLVFAKARCALEAAAVGAAVVLCDVTGLGPLVTAHELDVLRRRNFGWRTLASTVTVDGLLREIARYDAADAGEVSRRIRATAGLDRAVEELETLYAAVIEEQRQAGPDDLAAEERALALWLGRVAPSIHEARDRARALSGADGERDQLRRELAAMRDTLTWRVRDRFARRAWLARTWARLRSATASR